MSCTAPRGQARASANSRRSASLAAASTGGAVTWIFNSLPTGPTISFLAARGWSLTARQTPLSCTCRKAGIDWLTTLDQRPDSSAEQLFGKRARVGCHVKFYAPSGKGTSQHSARRALCRVRLRTLRQRRDAAWLLRAEVHGYRRPLKFVCGHERLRFHRGQ